MGIVQSAFDKTIEKMNKRQTKPEEMNTDQNPLYGQYYKVDA